ncbi:MAG: DUF1501 domain-containing protein [Nibricoccus sp.]
MKAPAISRRSFLGQASCAAVSSLPVLSTLLNLRMAGNLAAATAPAAGEYRALVCVFLSGGNDSFNMLVPREQSTYNTYASARADLAIARDSLLAINPVGLSQFGVHPAMPGIQALFENGKAAFVANVGTLIERVQNRTQVNQNLRRLPLGLYSHSDQIEQWQTSIPHSRSGVGWAGRMADLLTSLNDNPTVPMNISIDGSNIFQTGHNVAEYSVTPDGAVALSRYDSDFIPGDYRAPFSSGVDSQLALTYSNLLQQTLNTRKRAALDAYSLYADATATALPSGVSFPNTYLGNRLAQVARTIQGRAMIGAKRQTFFVNWGGWDHHDEVINAQAGMLPQVSEAIAAFHAATVAMGVENNVTLFTGSDFGRTLTSNNRGSDHAWGGNQLVVGGAVQGRRIFGQYPSLLINPESGAEVNPLDTGRGRLIPTTSVDEYFAELALWLGVSRTNLPYVLPNIGNFLNLSGTDSPLGFLA